MFHVKHELPIPDGAEEVFGDRLGLAQRYAEWLATAGIERGLLGPREVPRIWERHILNSAVLAEIIPQDLPSPRVIDVGSGAGLPGIPVALARPDIEMQLLEPLLRRVIFLKEVIEDLDIPVSVYRGRAEDKEIILQLGDADIVTSRAVAPLGRLCTWSLPLVKSGGSLRALKGSSVSEEIRRDAKEIKKAGGLKAEVHEIGASILREPTHAIVIPKK